MNITQLIEELEYLKETVGGDAEVRWAAQPQYPFEYSIDETIVHVQNVVYLAEGSQIGYLPGKAAKELSWS
jgi:hypothetical protein